MTLLLSYMAGVYLSIPPVAPADVPAIPAQDEGIFTSGRVLNFVISKFCCIFAAKIENMKIKVLTAHSACVDTHFSWGEGYQENYYVEHSTMCLIPENTVLTPREAKKILDFCHIEHERFKLCWEYNDDESKYLARRLGEKWEGGNFAECTEVGVEKAQKVWKETIKKYNFLTPYLYHVPEVIRDVDKSAIYFNDIIKRFYVTCIREIPESRIDEGIDYIEINYSYIKGQIEKIINSIYIPAIRQSEQHLENVRKPFVQIFESNTGLCQMDLDAIKRSSVESLTRHFVSAQPFYYLGDGGTRQALIPPLDLAMYFEDLDLVVELLKKGARNTIFSDLSLEYIETNLKVIKQLYNEEEYFDNLFPLHKRKILSHYFNEEVFRLLNS